MIYVIMEPLFGALPALPIEDHLRRNNLHSYRFISIKVSLQCDKCEFKTPELKPSKAK